MWIVTLDDRKTEEQIEVIAGDGEELQKILQYVNDSEDRFVLFHIEQRYMCYGFDDFVETIEDGNDDIAIPDTI